MKYKYFLLLILIVYACDFSKKNEQRINTKKIVAKGALEKSLIDQGLVNIQEVDSSIKVQLKYSTTDNFFKKDVYGNLTNAYAQPSVVSALRNVNQKLQKKYPNFRLIIYDAVRPHHIQYVLWNALPKIPPKKRKDFVADPLVGSIHNFGCAIDLSIFDIKSKQALDMGTKYDYFGFLAYPRKEEEMLKIGKLNEKQIANRLILRNFMQSEGFAAITSEWWHFNYLNLKDAKLRYKIIK